jgi:hypothetical protein|tara:strand:+ start:1457 stop:1795 length:339 start_codon:yes stop_codon:yes gene_type:complete
MIVATQRHNLNWREENAETYRGSYFGYYGLCLSSFYFDFDMSGSSWETVYAHLAAATSLEPQENNINMILDHVQFAMTVALKEWKAEARPPSLGLDEATIDLICKRRGRGMI